MQCSGTIMDKEVTNTTKSSNTKDKTPSSSNWEDQCIDPYHKNIANGRSEGYETALKASYQDGTHSHDLVIIA